MGGKAKGALEAGKPARLCTAEEIEGDVCKDLDAGCDQGVWIRNSYRSSSSRAAEPSSQPRR